MSAAQFCTEDFLSARTLEEVDETVFETFGVMLGLAALHDAGARETEMVEEDTRTGLIGFSGVLRGSCELRMDAFASRAIASAMLGGAVIEENDDDSVNDSVGEICNMLAAGWKNRVESLAGRCFLSPPTVISGRGYRVRPTYASVRIVRHYRFDAHAFQITINCVEFGC